MQSAQKKVYPSWNRYRETDHNGAHCNPDLPLLSTFPNMMIWNSSPSKANMLSTTSSFYEKPIASIIGPVTHGVDDKNPATATVTSRSRSMPELCKEYGPLVWNTYWGVYFGTFGSLALSVQSGILNPLRLVGGTSHQTVSDCAVGFLQKHAKLSRYAPYVQRHPAAANYLVAWLITEALEPVRIVATGVLVPVIAKRKSSKQSGGASDRQNTHKQPLK